LGQKKQFIPHPNTHHFQLSPLFGRFLLDFLLIIWYNTHKIRLLFNNSALNAQNQQGHFFIAGDKIMAKLSGIDYLMFKLQSKIVKVDPDIYLKIFNTSLESRRKYNGDIKSVRMSPDGYPVVIIGKNPSRHVPLARFAMNAEPGQLVDHRNRNPLDCRRSNLRFATRRQNNLNKKSNNDTGFFGVCIKHQAKRTYCSAKFMPADGKELVFQLPDNPANRIVAAFARDKFVLLCGDEEFAPLNFPCFKYEPLRSILLSEDLRKYKTERNANCQLEFNFMKHFKSSSQNTRPAIVSQSP
jgi:hypothetical protein